MTEERQLRINSPLDLSVVKPKFVLVRLTDTENLVEMLNIPEGMSRYVKCYYEVFLVDLHLVYHHCSAQADVPMRSLYNSVECHNPDGGDLPDDVQEWLDSGPECAVDRGDCFMESYDLQGYIKEGKEGETHYWVYPKQEEYDAEMAEHIDDADGNHDRAYELWVEDLREFYQGNHYL